MHTTASKHQPKERDIIIAKSNNKTRGTWPLAIVRKTYPGRDGIIREVELKTSNGIIERPVQFLYPLELECDITSAVRETNNLNPEAPQFRPRRDAAATEEVRVKQIQAMEDNEV